MTQTHSKMVQTRRKREAARKRQARADKLAKKLANPRAPAAPREGEAAPA